MVTTNLMTTAAQVIDLCLSCLRALMNLEEGMMAMLEPTQGIRSGTRSGLYQLALCAAMEKDTPQVGPRWWALGGGRMCKV